MADNTARITTPPEPPKAFADLAQKASESQESAVIATLPDGRTVLLERPKGSIVTRTLIIASELVGEMEPGAGQAIALSAVRAYVEALMYVRAIDSDRTMPITSAAVYNVIANKLGDDGIEAIQTEVYKHWPPPGLKDKETLKKNLP